MTRPRAASEAFVRMLPDDIRAKLRPVYAPLIDIVACNVDVPMGPEDAAIFTSANGVFHGPESGGRTAYCVGPATTDAAFMRGWNAQQSGETAQDLLTTLLQNPPEQRLFHLSGTHTRGSIATKLAQGGMSAFNIAIYDQVPVALNEDAHALLSGTRPVLVPLFSPRTAALFAAEAPASDCAIVAAFSQAVADALGNYASVDLCIAAAPNAKAMCDTVIKQHADLSSG